MANCVPEVVATAMTLSTSGLRSNTWFLGPIQAHNPKTASWSVRLFLQGSLVWQTDRPSDYATRSVTVGRIYICSTAMRPNNYYVYWLKRAGIKGMASFPSVFKWWVKKEWDPVVDFAWNHCLEFVSLELWNSWLSDSEGIQHVKSYFSHPNNFCGTLPNLWTVN